MSDKKRYGIRCIEYDTWFYERSDPWRPTPVFPYCSKKAAEAAIDEQLLRWGGDIEIVCSINMTIHKVQPIRPLDVK